MMMWFSIMPLRGIGLFLLFSSIKEIACILQLLWGRLGFIYAHVYHFSPAFECKSKITASFLSLDFFLIFSAMFSICHLSTVEWQQFGQIYEAMEPIQIRHTFNYICLNFLIRFVYLMYLYLQCLQSAIFRLSPVKWRCNNILEPLLETKSVTKYLNVICLPFLFSTKTKSPSKCYML